MLRENPSNAGGTWPRKYVGPGSAHSRKITGPFGDMAVKHKTSNTQQEVRQMQRTRKSRRSQRRARLILGLILILILLLGMTYLFISLYFRKHFFPHTEINGLKVGGMTAKEAEEKIAADVGDYLLTIFDRDGEKYHIMGREIDNSYVPDGSLEKALQAQNGYAWIPALFRENLIDVDTPMIYSAQKLAEAVAALPCFAPENITVPVNAALERTEQGYAIVPEVPGNQMILEKVVAAVEAAVTAGEGNLTLTDEVYTVPERLSSSPELIDALNRVNACIGAEVTYKISDYDEKLTSDQILDMIEVQEDFSIILDEKKLADYVQKLASKYNTYADVREFATSSGDKIKIGGGDYGWVIQKEKEAEQLKENILSGAPTVREPVYSQRAQVEGFEDIGTTYVEIDYTKQHMWYYEEGQLVLESDIVSGNIATGNGSPDGVFKIVYKQSPAVLKGEDYESNVDYFMPFAYNVGIHDASWRTQFGGEFYKTTGSHGCINAPGEIASELYGRIKVDTPVIAYYREKVELTAENCRISNAYSYVKPPEDEKNKNGQSGAGETEGGEGAESPEEPQNQEIPEE